MLTQYLGYQMTNDEYKVMSLSSYGSPDYLGKFAKFLRPCGGNCELDPELDKRIGDAEIFTSDSSTRQECIFTEEMEEISGPQRLRGQPLDQRLTNIAASGCVPDGLAFTTVSITWPSELPHVIVRVFSSSD